MTNDKKKREKKKRSFWLMDKGAGGWLCLIFFVSAWMFVLGVFVGRGTAPVTIDIEKLQKELVALKEAFIKKEQELFKIDSDVVRNKTDFGFYEALKKSKKYNNKGADISDKQETKHLPQNKTVEVKKKVIYDKAKVNRVKQENQATRLIQKTETDKKYTIQVASFKDSRDADKIVAKLRKKGYPAYRISSNIPEKGTWHRVRIGSFKDKAEAGSTLDKLKKEKFKAFLVNR